MNPSIYSIELSESEVNEIQSIIGELQTRYHSTDDDGFVSTLPEWVEFLPTRLRIELKKFRYQSYPLVVIKGYPDMSEAMGATPNHWKDVCNTNSHYDYYCCLMSSLCGDVVGFSDLQEGKLVQEIFPIKKDASKQLGTGAVNLFLHTEDTSLDYRADYLGFMCIRNNYRIPTSVSVPDFSKLSEKTIAILKQNKFRIFNDRPCLSKEERDENYTVCPILTGSGDHIHMRYDPLYLDKNALSSEEREAMDELEALTEATVFDLVLSPGEIAFIDNYRCAHGRKAYQPRYDGTDRWLKRTQILTRLRDFKHLMLPDRINVLP
ncbi:TauD/TfdA family dioxygenase [Xenorhabdus nematophila]|uniref:Clavaminate synthase n=1 Tax=Xenorhabdus nematophila (strain ATCC 19061 / DSM 3370 / CCUG 14189 / LMG 1036 / NCIMB 9965 / AN6) TaxID=406817 RepID=D3VEV2_XENNA|nr:TauD/TfdA family dioxygenase [Xenorhabdus nematophila]CEE94627.1 putative Clavaminate synthase [Xenorhabdus nematophila str. Anatoliense]CBJ90214.1 putative Clavaminate synthase [Xenorhabdus nematophila ATCC 19061]CCW32185.1 putative Clavaminate synthase [Xenorhabdus nematophila F1]CEE96019.1 putative Clavaminate synthase [Xenorhabdus nematophila str. Anatoliense]CEK23078.1 putative Clavaminate synthase [Xenorhabdus nematophila AN6/1]